jgi:hypothetical protein
MFMEQAIAGPMVLKGKFHGPISNNYESHLTASLGSAGTGILDRGRRFIASGDAVRPVDAPAGGAVTLPGALEGVLRVADALGGGFVFYTNDSVFHAPRFDAPLTRLGSGAVRSFIVGVECVFVRMADGTSALLRLADGRPVAGVPADVVGLRAHSTGFMVGLTRDTSGPPTHVYFTKDARTWKKLAIAGARDNDVYADGDALAVMTDATNGFRIGRDGKAMPIVLTPDEAMEKMMLAMVGGAPPEPTKVPDGGALLTGGWIPSSRHGDEWFLLRGGQLYVARGAEVRKVGPEVRGDLSCAAVEVERQPLLLCAQLGTSMLVYRLDLETGARVLEREVKVTQGVATHIGMGNMYPQAVMIAATCDGRADAGYCVRDVTGAYHTFDAPPQGTKGSVFIFPGEVIYALPDATGAIELQRAGTSERVTFSAETMKPLNATLGVDPGATMPDLPFTTSGIARLPTRIRMFHGPNPFRPAPASPMNHALDLPLDGARPTILSVPGVIATAGLHALRLDGGKLYESADGWATWHEVAPPPTGVPADLDGAMCDERGCLFGAWARVGWERALPERPTPSR